MDEKYKTTPEAIGRFTGRICEAVRAGSTIKPYEERDPDGGWLHEFRIEDLYIDHKCLEETVREQIVKYFLDEGFMIVTPDIDQSDEGNF